jgi:AcrR family transcriptional regulator
VGHGDIPASGSSGPVAGGAGPVAGGAGPAGGGPVADGAGPEAQRGRPRSAEADRAILDAAASLLAERGLTGMSIEEVAARAGVGKATIYRRWPSKGLLALDAFMIMFRSLQPPVDTGSLRGDLLSALRAWVRAVTNTPAGRLLASLIAEAQHDAELHAAWRSRVLEPLRAQHRVVLERAVARGEVSPAVDQDVVLDLFFGAAQHRLLLGHLELTESFVESVVDVLLSGIATAPPA